MKHLRIAALALLGFATATQAHQIWRGQPAGQVTQSGWAKEGRTDAQGAIKFDMPWQGTYVAEASHTDRTPGERGADKYDGVSYGTILTDVKAEGVAPMPAGPAAPPKK